MLDTAPAMESTLLRTVPRATDAAWQAIRLGAALEDELVGDYAAELLTRAAALDLPSRGTPEGTGTRRSVTWRNPAALGPVQAWRSRRGMTWPEALTVAAGLAARP